MNSGGLRAKPTPLSVAGGNEIARLQPHAARENAGGSRDIENLMARIGRLFKVAIDPGAHIERLKLACPPGGRK